MSAEEWCDKFHKMQVLCNETAREKKAEEKKKADLVHACELAIPLIKGENAEAVKYILSNAIKSSS
jgi:hypothetical protein